MVEKSEPKTHRRSIIKSICGAGALTFSGQVAGKPPGGNNRKEGGLEEYEKYSNNVLNDRDLKNLNQAHIHKSGETDDPENIVESADIPKYHNGGETSLIQIEFEDGKTMYEYRRIKNNKFTINVDGRR